MLRALVDRDAVSLTRAAAVSLRRGVAIEAFILFWVAGSQGAVAETKVKMTPPYIKARRTVFKCSPLKGRAPVCV